jgi:hypothetical protein
MANLTISVDDATLKRARLRALQRGESVNTFLADALRRYADGGERPEPMNAVLLAARRSAYGSGPQGRQWTRDDARRG